MIPLEKFLFWQMRCYIFEHPAVSEELEAATKTSIRVLHVSEQASKWLSVQPVNHLILLQNQLLQHISIATQPDNGKMILDSYCKVKKNAKNIWNLSFYHVSPNYTSPF